MTILKSAHMPRAAFGGGSTDAPPAPGFMNYPHSVAQRLALALRALDGRIEGNSYRAIAEGLFGARHMPERAWKTHDLRNRTIRLVQTGSAMMRGGYRALLRPAKRQGGRNSSPS
jgi:hypothetical protein